jgi:cellulose synthase/poly-beta-1,6-N-acetylglucosamine synthase-like glycosyltransferase
MASGIINLIQLFLLINILYLLSVGIFGLRRYYCPPQYKPSKRFAIVIPAHNEERVISQLIHNLQKLDYPTNLYDIFVLCDNCTDRTASIARNLGVQVMERFHPHKKSKGYALSWMFNNLLSSQSNNWDAFVILDADNIVSQNFLQIMNNYLQHGHQLLQGCLDVKNPDDSWITKCYSLFYWITNRMIQLSRYNLGWSCILGGTGICVTAKLLQETGWNAASLMEDLEFTIQCMLTKNVRATWVHDAKIYDEKPTSFVSSTKQRIRWMKGFADCCFRYMIPLFKLGIKTRNKSMLDLCMYLMQPLFIVTSGIFIVISIIQNFHPFYWSLWERVPLVFRDLLVVVEISIPLIGLLLERVGLRRIFWILYLPIFSITWIPITIIGIVRHRVRNWSHTEHTRVVTDEEFIQLTSLAFTDGFQEHKD